VCICSVLQVCSDNEGYERELAALREGGAAGGGAEEQTTHALEDEIRQLKAQNAVLQKQIAACTGVTFLPVFLYMKNQNFISYYILKYFTFM